MSHASASLSSARTRNLTARSSARFAPRSALPALAGAVIRVLYQHRIATTTQLHQLLTPEAADSSYLRRVLRQISAAGLVDAVLVGPAGHRAWFLTPSGYTVAEACGDLNIQAYRMSPALAAGGLLAHRLAVVDVGAVFVTAARRQPGDECTPWSWAPEVLLQPGKRRGGGGALIADAELHYELAEGGTRRWLIEVDRGTYLVPRLAAKLTAYADWWRTPQSRPWHQARLLIVFAMPAPAAARRIASLAEFAWQIPQLRRTEFGRLRIGAVGYDTLAQAGPWAPVFTDVLDGSRDLLDATLGG